jgi:hypothetical protein
LPQPPPNYDATDDTDPAALSDFHDGLAPYGAWVDDPTYGVVWVPSASAVGDEFTPYVTNGHWALADDGGWMWVSDFNWGWAPFHYGRWLWIGGRGWSWIPGRVYSNAWVVWRTGYYDDYYVGWAPMPPAWYWHGGFAYRLSFVPPAPYVFCSSRYVFYPHVHSYIVPAARVGVIAPRTHPYVAASATVGPATYRTAAMTRGPTMGEAHIPAGSVPTQRVAPDRRLAYPMPSQPHAYAPQASGMPQRDAPYRTPYPQQPSSSYARPSSPQAYSRPSPPSVYYSRPAPAEVARPTVRPSMPYAPPRADTPRVYTAPAPRPAAPAPAAPYRPQTAPLRKVPARR